MMSAIGQCQSCSPYSTPPGFEERRTRSRPGQAIVPKAEFESSSARSRASQSETTYQLVVRTEDGDLITISAKAVQSSRSTQYSSLSRNAEGVSAATYRDRQRESSFDFSIQVDGDLSKEEIDDLRKLASALSRAARQVDRGDAAGAIRAASFAQDPNDSIASFEFSYQRTQQLEEMRARQVSYFV
jgi:hypothetical protein